MLHPANVTRRFIELYEEIDLPLVRLTTSATTRQRLRTRSGPV